MKESKLKFLILFLLVFPLGLMAQSIKMEGNVKDAVTGEPLPGVTVVIRGTSIGTITDIDGRFSIMANKGNTLEVSYIGYLKQEFKIKGPEMLSVLLAEDAVEMGEVVVVGASMKKSDLTGSVARIGGEALREIPTADLSKSLQGKVAGVFVSQQSAKPGEAAKIKIRGANSIAYGTEPIYVVDGLIMDQGFGMLNPNDIATIDILKDASATAIYGSRGANGVVLITTKKGQVGRGRVTYDGWFGWQSFSKDMPMMDANGIWDLRVDAYANAYMDNNPTADRQKYIDRYLTINNASRNLIFSKEELEAHANGLSYNWLPEVLQSGFQHNHAVSFSGGTDKGSYFLSFNYNQQTGQLKNSGYERYSGKVNIDQKLNSWLRVGTNNTFVYANSNPVGNDDMYINSLKADPLLPISEEYWYLKEGKIDNQSASNPLRDLYIIRDQIEYRYMTSNFININPIKGLDIRSTFSLDLKAKEDYTYYPTNTTQSYKNSADGEAHQNKDKMLNWQWDNTVSYNTIVAEKHKISALVGMNMSYYSSDWNNVMVRGFGEDFFDYKSIGGATKKEDFGLSSDFTTYSLMSAFFRGSYTYDSRYYVTFTGRFDGSSRFGSNNKWGFFPSVSASWNITGEKFMEDVNVINNLRLRVGYGLAGNQNIPNYRYRTLYETRPTLGSTVLVNNGEFGNPNLRWEQQEQINVGLDYAMFKDRLTLTLDYFYINNNDLLMSISKASSEGYTSQIANVGALRNQGVEFTISGTPIKTKDWNWTVSFNISADQNQITRLDGLTQEIYKLGGWSNNEIQREGNLFVGQPLNNLYVYEFDRIVQESDMEYVNSLELGSRVVKPGDILPKDKDGNGIINDKDRLVVGKKDPDFYGGLHTSLSWKGLELNIVANYSVGGKQFSYLYETLMNSIGNGGAHADLANRWTPDNTQTNIPRAFSDGGRFGLGETSWGLQDASFFRLSAVTLSYTLPKKWLNSVYLDNLRIYVTGNNLLTATNYKGYDPESGDWYPSSRMVVAGLNISF